MFPKRWASVCQARAKSVSIITIRKLRLSDLPSVVEILQNSLPHHPRYKALRTSNIQSIYLRFNFEKWASRIGQCIRQGSLRLLFTDVYDRAAFVAEECNKLVGVAEAYPITNEEWLVDSIAVLSDYRRRGIGRQLMKKLIAHIKKKGGKKMRLYVQPHNISAIRFYTKLGFTTAPQHILMTINLGKGQKKKANLRAESRDLSSVKSACIRQLK